MYIELLTVSQVHGYGCNALQYSQIRLFVDWCCERLQIQCRIERRCRQSRPSGHAVVEATSVPSSGCRHIRISRHLRVVRAVRIQGVLVDTVSVPRNTVNCASWGTIGSAINVVRYIAFQTVAHVSVVRVTNGNGILFISYQQYFNLLNEMWLCELK